MTKKKVNESLSEYAGTADKDHEVQMARADLYNTAHQSIELHKILSTISEEQGLEGWQQAKITKAADYINSVFKSLQYDQTMASAPMPPPPPAIVNAGVRSAMSETQIANYKALLEKAKSKAQQKFMGMVHAAQKGEEPASAAVADVAKDMPKKAAKDYAATKHKGLPAHVSEAQVTKPTEWERLYATDGSPNPSANMKVNKLSYALDKEPKKKVSLAKTPGVYAGKTKEAQISEAMDDDDVDTKVKSPTYSRSAMSPAQAAAWRQDAFDRSDAAVKKYPDFFTDEHMDRVDRVVDIIERVLTPSKFHVTHRFGKTVKGKPQPFTSIAIYHPTFPGAAKKSSSARDRIFYEPLADLGALYDGPLSNAPGFLIHVIV